MKTALKKIRGAILNSDRDEELRARITSLERNVDTLQKDISVLYISCKPDEEFLHEEQIELKSHAAQSKHNFAILISFILCGISGIAIGWLALNL
tara:strand:- start:1508 stop:1792 length:285 start_codon:yes stop_codon:yes gene_type:complete